MRILFDQAVYDMRNKGNVALLQMAVERISQRWPNASLEVITLAPHLLRLYCPMARPASPDGAYNWSKDHSLLDGLIWRMPRPMLRLLFELREEAWRFKSVTRAGLRRLQLKTAPAPAQQPHAVESQRSKQGAVAVTDQSVTFKTVNGVDLFVATGAQYMSDACKPDALRVLDRLETANQLGIPTAMVGQGIGPIVDTELRARATAVLPRVDLILIRERLESPQLLASFGVAPSRVILTGDDAIELAYRARTIEQRNDIGVSMRFAHYTQIGNKQVEIVQPVLRQAALKFSARLIAVPISYSAHELDDRVLRQLLARQNNAVHSRWRFDTPLEIVKRVGRCRIVVTGTFHTAVFALSQGIPAIGLAKSSMYMDKFLGLADQFGQGCQVVYLDDEQMQTKLTKAIDGAWESAEQVRPQLLEAAARQIQLGQAAYQSLYELVESRNREK